MSEIYKVLGLMSGTSLDGLDIAFCEFELRDKTWSFRIIESSTITYDDFWVQSLRNSRKLSSSELEELDKAYGNFLGSAVLGFVKETELIPDFVASHGHTVFHEPELGITKQIGNGPEIHNITGFKVVCDFRVADVALGGQGAPLVPIGDQLLFNAYQACINIGGFSNISFDYEGKRVAFDISPANIVLNALVAPLGWKFDRNGDLARSGQIVSALLEKLNSLEYYQLPIPKSLGVEWVDEEFWPLIPKSVSTEDLLCTIVEHIAIQIAHTLDAYHISNVLMSGGGVYNDYLLSRISKHFSGDVQLPSNEVIEFKEALIFGFLGVLRIREEVNVLGSVTGAEKDHSSGHIYL